MSALETLRRARERISDPVRWCKRNSAVDATGRSCYELDPRASAWCAAGAVTREAPLDPWVRGAAYDLLYRARPLRFQSFQMFNDNERTTHADILALFDRAMVLAGEIAT